MEETHIKKGYYYSWCGAARQCQKYEFYYDMDSLCYGERKEQPYCKKCLRAIIKEVRLLENEDLKTLI